MLEANKEDMSVTQRPLLLLRFPMQENVAVYVYANYNGEAWIEYSPNLKNDRLKSYFKKQKDLYKVKSNAIDYNQVYMILDKTLFMQRNLTYIKSHNLLISDYTWHIFI